MSLLGMTGTIIKNLCAGPVTERYPFVPKEYPAGARGKVNIEINKCIFCGICQRKCPTAAITVTKEPKTWVIDRLRCISCSACVEVCPKKCLALDVKYSPCSVAAQKDSFLPDAGTPSQTA
ncbi:MAG: 4Fe-4S dicluster domain-containing protein [Candidatus Omnitrophica bacterium]|nr:4Fe-4S dicluster domain-containing protein [Candidatus Omnitrophota bacterium]